MRRSLITPTAGAVALLMKQTDAKPWHFITACNYLIRKKKYDDALRLMRVARELLPENPSVRMKSGDLYHNIGIMYRARLKSIKRP